MWMDMKTDMLSAKCVILETGQMACLLGAWARQVCSDTVQRAKTHNPSTSSKSRHPSKTPPEIDPRSLSPVSSSSPSLPRSRPQRHSPLPCPPPLIFSSTLRTPPPSSRPQQPTPALSTPPTPSVLSPLSKQRPPPTLPPPPPPTLVTMKALVVRRGGRRGICR